MQNFTITNGSFAKGEDNQGNFTGYTALGRKVFIFKQMLEELGITAKKPFDFTKGKLYVVAEPRTYEREDGSSFTRITAASVYTDAEQLVAAHVEDKALDVAVASATKTAASAAGVSSADLNLLRANS